MKIIIEKRIYIYDMPIIEKILKKHLTMTNPKYTDAIQNARRVYGIQKNISAYKKHKDCFSVPRGVEGYLCILCNKYYPDISFDDKTTYNVNIKFKCNITPYKEQLPAVNACLNNEVGVLQLPTGTGKTVVALYVTYKRSQKTFIICHTKELMYQWQARIKQFLDYDCGLVGDNHFNIKDITVGLVTSTINKNKKHNFCKDFGMLIVDENHKVPGRTFSECVSLFKSFYILGLTATPKRRDGLGNFIFWSLGDIIYKMNKSEAVRQGKILKPKIIKVQTNLFFNGERGDYVSLLSKLKKSNIRNQIIVDEIKKASQQNYSCCLVLSDHSTHLDFIKKNLDFEQISYHYLSGKISTKKRKQVVEDLNNNKVTILLATTSLIAEGFDYGGFTDLFLCMPISYDGRLEQILGRLIRTQSGKKQVRVYDFVDNNPVFLKQWHKRLKVYSSY